MANFSTHVTTSVILGAAYGTAAHTAYNQPLPSCLLAGGLCSIAGVLPDVDSDNAVILREILAFVSATIPMLLLDRFRAMQWPQESVVVAVAVLYICLRFGIGEVIRRVTVHRGMWHSIPAAIIVSSGIYYLCDAPDTNVRLFKASAVFIGFLWHLVLDEIYAVDSESGRMRVKKSFGTALKLFGRNPIANVFVYGQLLAIMSLLYVQESTRRDYPQQAGYHYGPAQLETLPGAATLPNSRVQLTPVPPPTALPYPSLGYDPYGPPLSPQN